MPLCMLALWHLLKFIGSDLISCHFRLFLDSSSFTWGGVLSLGAITVRTCDCWDSSVIGADIATKETLPLNNAL